MIQADLGGGGGPPAYFFLVVCMGLVPYIYVVLNAQLCCNDVFLAVQRPSVHRIIWTQFQIFRHYRKLTEENEQSLPKSALVHQYLEQNLLVHRYFRNLLVHRQVTKLAGALAFKWWDLLVHRYLGAELPVRDY